MTTDLQRRMVLLGVGTALAGAVAGCSGDGDSEGDGDPENDDDSENDGDGGTAAPDASDGTGVPGDGGDGETAESSTTDARGTETTSTPTSTGVAATSKEGMGSLATNRIDEFAFVGWRSEAPGQGMFNVYMTLTNEGSEAADVENYTWGIVPWKENGQEVTVSAAGPVITEYDGLLEPGDTGTVSYHVRVDDPSVIDSYEIHLSCAGTAADGQYCPE